MVRQSSPLRRYAGSAVSWLLFTFSFTLLAVGASIVMGLGGFCASGGPYVIQTQCPDVVAWTAPLSIFGGLIAVGIGFVLAGGFGTPLVSWAWPILFIGLGLAFLGSGLTSGVDGIVFDLLALMFIVMGGVPLVLELRASPQAFFLGTTDAVGTPFIRRATGHRSLYGFTRAGDRNQPFPTVASVLDPGQPDPGSPSTTPTDRAATARDWTLSLGILIVFGGLGIYLALLILGPHPAG